MADTRGPHDAITNPAVKSNIWDVAGGGHSRPRNKKTRRKSVAAILKEAYQRHVRDELTRRAVKRVLH